MYLSHKTTNTTNLYIQSAILVPPNHTNSKYITSQCPTCPSKPHALPLYTFTALYLSYQTKRTPNIYVYSDIPVPPNQKLSHKLPSMSHTCHTKPHAIPIYTFAAHYLPHQTKRTPTIYFHSTLPVPPNHTHTKYTNSQFHICSTKSYALSIYTFSLPYLFHQTTHTPNI